jgi:hypothetical protein
LEKGFTDIAMKTHQFIISPLSPFLLLGYIPDKVVHRIWGKMEKN